MSEPVVHNPSRHRFELNIGGQMVIAEYRLLHGVMTMHHTLTPPALRGRGLAAKVVEAALQYARAQQLKVVPTCWYVSEHIDLHPEHRDLIAEGPV